MKVFNCIPEWITARQLITNQSIGFVPTMGALHQGHFSLIEKSLNENDHTVVSLFLNPTQFDNPSDLANYPCSLAEDLASLETLKVKSVLVPTFNDIYPNGYKYLIQEKEFSNKLCGARRPGHFEGVLTVVMKLFNIVRPHTAYFGEKDFQQLQLIKEMVTDFFLPLKISAVPTVREKDGLAMSSRNKRLNSFERDLAPKFYEALKNSKHPEEAKEFFEEVGFKVDYIEEHNHRRFGAVYLGPVRLIDNVEV